MTPQVCFFLSIALSLVAWTLAAKLYIWPRLGSLARPDALRPLLLLHTFRFEGLAFLVPGVVSPDLPMAFAHSAAYGDLGAAILALLCLASLTSGAGVAIAWIFNIWGTFDLLHAFYEANAGGLVPGQLGAAYFIPTLLVPLLLVTHTLIFKILWRRKRP